ncbi:acetylornithine deacetylase [Candidatus Phycosocius spiralis]|uniref:Acetylornithine deacetylase n=1 Tax=Candidatus Phycosocius spiralis TaxID=2815099 RepID=A0ABQ4PXG7_9PROT|nr:acetylornithine deacetylase [Candidatus Phycosocius spiralis]GIU67675.1 acetylornithine deacetylase [Candidatus Phycosocius spiralis]
MNKQKLLGDTIEILGHLVSYDTTSRNSNLPLINWVETRTRGLGAVTRRIPNRDGTKANLIVSFGPLTKPGGIVLSGHTDVVPVDDQDWTSDPWTLVARDGRFYGRGTCDMKGFAACALALAPHMAEAKLTAPIHIALTYDEEIGCLGAPSLVRALGLDYAPLDCVIIGEPSDMRVVSGQKGLAVYQVEITGKAAHSSQVQQGVSAIMEAVPLLAKIYMLADQARAKAPKHSSFEPAGTTITIGVLQGGTASNILAQSCHFIFDIRFELGDDPKAYQTSIAQWVEELDAAIKLKAPEGGAVMTQRSFSPAMLPETNGKAEAMARALTGDNSMRAVAYATEGGIFQLGGLSTVICGPGSILQAHQPDEFIEMSQLQACVDFMIALVQRMRGDSGTFLS